MSDARPVLRRCVACRALLDRRQLWRLVRLAGGGGVALDTGMGRSAYVCRTAECLHEARRRRRFQRALRCPVNDQLVVTLEERLCSRTATAAEAD